MPISIQELKELMEKATPGPWKLSENSVEGWEKPYINGEDEASVYWTCCACDRPRPQDLEFIAALPDIARLALDLAEKRDELRKRVEGLRKKKEEDYDEDYQCRFCLSPDPDCGCEAYNEAIDDVLKLMDE